MKRLLVATFLTWCAGAYAMGPEYQSSCAWVVERCPTNKVPTQERVFIATTPGSAPPALVTILRYRRGLSIRGIIDQTRFRGTNAVVTVLRSQKPTSPAFYRVVKRDEHPAFALKPLDMIWVGDPMLPQ